MPAGRPKAQITTLPVNFRLQEDESALLKEACERLGVLPGRLLGRIIRAAFEATNGGSEAQDIAQECTAFLDAQVDRPAAVNALRRAWVFALAQARQDLTHSAKPSESTPKN